MAHPCPYNKDISKGHMTNTNRRYDLTAAEQEAIKKATAADWAKGFAMAATDPKTYAVIGMAFLNGLLRGLDR